jgi:muramoyltetrapeptide carboxypeptidase LdcA involved in peptidoglycan recycling
VHERGLRVVREDLGLNPVEYPTTRRTDATPAERAADLMAAFADPNTTAIMATIGGDDQLTVLPFLDAASIRANPKAFFGYSDNTNLLNWLWNNGIVGYHGGSTMVHLARGGRPHPVSLGSLRTALFETGPVELHPLDSFTDLHADWADPASLERELPLSSEPGWTWHNAGRCVSGPTWGGNLEILHWNLAAGRWIRPVDDYAGCVLLLETSEEMPSATEVSRMLRNMGERRLLQQFTAVIVAKPKAWDRDRNEPVEDRTRFRAEQEDAVLSTLAVYAPGTMVVLGPDLGHTDPQYVVPYGGMMTVDGPNRRLTAHY